MRVINSGNPNIAITVTGEHGAGGANYKYSISRNKIGSAFGEYGSVSFQSGPIKENGVNGCHQEDLLAIVIDRLQSFQEGPYPCRENAIALTKCQEAMHWLNHRAQNRTKRGSEGRNKA